MSTDPSLSNSAAVPDPGPGASGPTSEQAAALAETAPTPQPTPQPTATPSPDEPPKQGSQPPRPGLGEWIGSKIGADWAAVIVAAVLVLLAVSGALPAIPFLVK